MDLAVTNDEVESVQAGINRIKVGISKIREVFNCGHLSQITWAVWAKSFLTCGGVAIVMWRRYKRPASGDSMPVFNATEFADLLLRKSNAYGAGPIKAWGELGVIIRIDSKVERLQTLLYKPAQAKSWADEPLDDTIKDIVGYCVLGYRLVTTQGPL